MIEQPNAGIDSVEAWVSYALPANVENLKLVGYGNTDGWGNELDNAISGNGYSNILDGAGGNDTLAGGNSGDTFNVVSGEGSDTIVDFGAGAGVGDIANLDGFALTTFGAVQAAMSQDGDNTVLDFGNGQTLTFLNIAPSAFAADDFLFAHLPPPLFVPPPTGPEPFTLPISGAYTNTINGGFTADSLTGTNANNRLDGKQGNDTMTGLGGDDTYVVNAPGDVVVESANDGIDTVMSSGSSYALAANVENLTQSARPFTRARATASTT